MISWWIAVDGTIADVSVRESLGNHALGLLTMAA